MRATKTLSAEQFMRLRSLPRGCELVRGEVRAPMTPSYPYGRTQSRLIQVLGERIEARGQGVVLGTTGYVLADDPGTVRAPAVSILGDGPLARSPRGMYVHGPPLVAIEIRAPHSLPSRLTGTVRDFLAAGAREVWVVGLRTRTLQVHRPGGSARILDARAWHDAGDVCPGLRVQVSELLPDPVS